MSMEPHTWPRLYVQEALELGGEITLPLEQTHYLLHVLRAKEDAPIRVFNGRDGEWRASLAQLPARKKDGARLRLHERRSAQTPAPDLWLCCAPIKKARFDTIVEKATELGVSVIQPVLTARTQVRHLSLPHLQAIAVEAAEQSERLTVPTVNEPVTLEALLRDWPAERLPLLCAERGPALPIGEALKTIPPMQPHTAALFTGPEGGYTSEEIERIAALPQAKLLSLGARILRADTAVFAALACWQALCGDWTNDISKAGRSLTNKDG